MKSALLILAIAFAPILNAQSLLELNKGWKFRKAGSNTWYPAEVPGTVHTDLLTNKLIPDPFYRDNESKVQWVENETWEYRLQFNIPANIFRQKHLELQFDGLDSYADVFINSRKVIRADNMFRQWTADIKPIAKASGNELVIRFYPAALLAKAAKKSDSVARPENERIYVRKAQYQFGWDWGPRLVTCGIWKDVRLQAWDHLLIRNAQITPRKDEYLGLSMDILCDTAEVFSLKLMQGGTAHKKDHYLFFR